MWRINSTETCLCSSIHKPFKYHNLIKKKNIQIEPNNDESDERSLWKNKKKYNRYFKSLVIILVMN